MSNETQEACKLSDLNIAFAEHGRCYKLLSLPSLTGRLNSFQDVFKEDPSIFVSWGALFSLES